MSARRSKVVVEGAPAPDDDLLLPRPPGVFRRFWARHPLFADIVIAAVALLLSTPPLAVRGPLPETVSPWIVAVGAVLVLIGCAALVWRRRWPVTVFAVTLLPTLVIDPGLAAGLSAPAAVIGIYSVAVYRGVRATWIAFAAAGVLLGLHAVLRELMDPGTFLIQLNLGISSMVLLLLGVLIGINVGNRRRYLEALIDRSRQLLVERDQQARLAAAAERARIAREMHDIVAHSLTVIVALSEGAAAATAPERARDASRNAAETARSALGEMRAMLGVLRSDADEAMPLEPLEPIEPADIVATAQRAGYPVVAEFTGTTRDAPRAVRFALGRVVQESVTNAMRHAPTALNARVVVRAGDDAIEILVENDGVAPDRRGAEAGYGVRGLRERVEHVGGTLEAGDVGDGRWRVVAKIPLAPTLEQV